MINIALYDDHPVISSGLKPILESNLKETNCIVYSNASQLKNETDHLDFVILDIVTPDVKGLELFDWYKSNYPKVKVLAYSTLQSPILLENLSSKGIEGYVNKREDIAVLIDAIETVLNGKTWYPNKLETNFDKDAVSQTISERELEILELLSLGKITKEISAELFISTKTVDNHKSNLFKKFKASNTIELLQKARDLGYIEN